MTKLNARNRPRRRLGRLTLFALLAALALGLLGAAYADWQWHRTVLTVVNRSGGPVDDVVVSLARGPGRYALGRLRDREAKSVQVFPGDEDGLALRFLSGERTVVWGGQYENGEIGHHPRVIIGKDGDVRGETGLYSP